MLNVNIQKIAQARKALLSQQQFDTAVAEIEAYFNDEQNFLKNELSLQVTLTEENYQRLVPLLQEVGLFSRNTPQRDLYTVFFSESAVVEDTPLVTTVEQSSTPVLTVNPNAFAPPVENVFQPTVDPIFDQAPVVEDVVVEIKDSLQKPAVAPVVSSNNTQNLFVMPDDHLTYNDSPF